MKKFLILTFGALVGLLASYRSGEARTVASEVIQIAAGGLYNAAVGTNGAWANGYCLLIPWTFAGTPASGNCSAGFAYLLGLSPLPLDTQVRVKDLTCGFDKTTFETGDTLTLNVAECDASSCVSVGSGLTIADATPDAAVASVSINTLTTKTADYALYVKISSVTDAAADTAFLTAACWFTYQVP